jgi:hypothetical protein
MKTSLLHKQKGTTIPFLNLPGIGQVPNLPATLTASTSLQF